MNKKEAAQLIAQAHDPNTTRVLFIQTTHGTWKFHEEDTSFLIYQGRSELVPPWAHATIEEAYETIWKNGSYIVRMIREADRDTAHSLYVHTFRPEHIKEVMLQYIRRRSLDSD